MCAYQVFTTLNADWINRSQPLSICHLFSILSRVGRNPVPLPQGRDPLVWFSLSSFWGGHVVLMLGHQRAEDIQEPGQSWEGGRLDKLLHNSFCARPFPFPTSPKPTIFALHKGMSQGLEMGRGPRTWPSIFLVPRSSHWCKWQPGALENTGTSCWRGAVRKPSPFR